MLARHRELSVEARLAGLNAWLEAEVWSKLPPEILGTGLSKPEQEAIIGIGPDGY